MQLHGGDLLEGKVSQQSQDIQTTAGEVAPRKKKHKKRVESTELGWEGEAHVETLGRDGCSGEGIDIISLQACLFRGLVVRWTVLRGLGGLDNFGRLWSEISRWRWPSVLVLESQREKYDRERG